MCPFQEDKTPSLVVSPKTSRWHRPDKCNVGGSTIDWVMRRKGVSVSHAFELLRTDQPIEEPRATETGGWEFLMVWWTAPVPARFGETIRFDRAKYRLPVLLF